MTESLETRDIRALAAQGYWPAMAATYFDEEKYAKVVDLCLRMLEKEPQVISGRVILARALYHAGQHRQAREQFVEVLKLDPANIIALKYLGDLLYREGEKAAAMAYYRRVFEIDPQCGGVACSLDREDAIETTQLTIKRSGEKVESKPKRQLREPVFITETVGDIYREQGYLQLAREVYRRLLVDRRDTRIADKLRETEDKLSKKGK
jgi:tetratricopeptide (TPR) repeat protein